MHRTLKNFIHMYHTMKNTGIIKKKNIYKKYVIFRTFQIHTTSNQILQYKVGGYKINLNNNTFNVLEVFEISD